MKRLRDARSVAILALLALAMGALPAAAGGDETTQKKKIYVKKFVHDCEGDDCGDNEQIRHVIVVGDDGEVHDMEGDATAWIGHGADHDFSFAHHGKGGFLGVATSELTPELRRHFGVPEDAGVLVAKVVDGSAAATAGVQVGDILTAVDGNAVDSASDLIHAIRKLEPGAAVDLELWRDGTLQSFGATLGERQHSRRHAMVMRCGDEGEDCPQIAALHDFDCGENSDCKIKIECRDSDCECTINGETAECETLPGFEAPGE
jgi:hypothetical protein